MSDSQLSAHQPVFPPTKDPGSGEGPRQDEIPASDETPSTDDRILIGEKEYTAAEIEDVFTRRDSLQADYTRKTQALAEQRRQLEEERREVEEMKARFSGSQATDANGDPFNAISEGIDPNLGQVLRRLDERISHLNTAIESREKQAQREAEEDAALEANLDRLSSEPGFERERVLRYALNNALDMTNPAHARVAYEGATGFTLGRALGERAAVERGAGVPAPMGASPSSISPGFTHPSEISRGPIEDQSWNDLARAAQNDPEVR